MDPRIVIHAPDEQGGQRVHVDGTILGMAHSETDLCEILRRVELPDWDAVDIEDRSLFKREGGARRPGPERESFERPDELSDARITLQPTLSSRR
ncbi:hypothetical protein ACFVRB_11295 [Streptomyces nojiriensis]|uniref:hypothetical protein n=1 Tax=Streptomyces nojiriensis TaxID=66374 RepID=UPI0036DDB15F